MYDDRETANEIVAIFEKKNGVYSFDSLQAIDYKGNIVFGGDGGHNISEYDEITMDNMVPSLESITPSDERKVVIKEKEGSNKGFYRVSTAVFFANFLDGKFYSNFIDSEMALKAAENYLKNPSDRHLKNLLYKNLYFRILYDIASRLCGINIQNNIAISIDNNPDPVAIHELAECASYKRPYTYTSLINCVMSFIDSHLPKPVIAPQATIKPTIIRENNAAPLVSSAKTPSNIPCDINQIIQDASEKFIGQEQGVKDLALNIYYNIYKIAKLPEEMAARNKASIFLDGSTGTGKTAILKELATKFNVPIVITGATQYSTVGYKGADLTDILIGLLNKAKGDLELAQRGVVFFDEFDKLAFNGEGKNDLVFKKGLQDELLKYIEGSVFQIEYNHKVIDFDTSKVTFICGGAFTSLRDKKIKKNSKKAIGFASTYDTKETDSDSTYKLTNQDFIDFGIQRELIGRLKTKINLKTYSKEELLDILRTSTISPLTEFTTILCSDPDYTPGVYISEEFIERVADMAAELGTGVRALQEIMEGVRTSLLEDIIIKQPPVISLTTELLDHVEKKQVRSY